MGYHSSESQLAFHICYEKHENTLTCKRISWDSGVGGNDVLKIFFSISYVYNTNIDYFSPKIKPYIYGNKKQMQNHKIETISELIYEDGSI